MMGSVEDRQLAVPIVALDVSDLGVALDLVDQIGEGCGFYKIGLELFSAAGPEAVRRLRERGKRVFVDLKLHDIPNTVGKAAGRIAGMGASLLTVHAVGGIEMIRSAVAAAEREFPECRVLAVTVLTSIDGVGLGSIWDRPDIDVGREVVRLAGMATDSGAFGIVCSGHELGMLRARYASGLRYLVPGIRLAGGDAHDQSRVMTPGQASISGADWLVIGRAVTGSSDPRLAMEEVLSDIRVAKI